MAVHPDRPLDRLELHDADGAVTALHRARGGVPTRAEREEQHRDHDEEAAAVPPLPEEAIPTGIEPASHRIDRGTRGPYPRSPEPNPRFADALQSGAARGYQLRTR